MSHWMDRILREFPTDLSRLWIAADPDDVLLDEPVLSNLRDRGFDVLPFEDSVAFRTEYEERYRDAWEAGETPSARALILHLQGTQVDDLPWDYLRSSRRANLSLADLFPKLSYGVVRQIGSEHYEFPFRGSKPAYAATARGRRYKRLHPYAYLSDQPLFDLPAGRSVAGASTPVLSQ